MKGDRKMFNSANDELQKYVGEKVKVDLGSVNAREMGVEYIDWYGDSSGEEPCLGGSGTITVINRNYLDDEDSDGEEDFGMDEEDEEEEEYDEESDWTIEIRFNMEVDDDGTISSIDIDAEVFSFGDSGLGDCDPEDEWNGDDLKLAEAFLQKITE